MQEATEMMITHRICGARLTPEEWQTGVCPQCGEHTVRPAGMHSCGQRSLPDEWTSGMCPRCGE